MSWDSTTDGARVAELIMQVRRIADALDRLCPITTELTDAELEELDRINAEADAHTAESLEETLAMMEILEDQGKRVPDAAYRRFGLEPPDRKLATVDEAALAADQAELAKPPEPERPTEPANPNAGASDGIVSTRKAGL